MSTFTANALLERFEESSTESHGQTLFAVKGYLTDKKKTPPEDPDVGLCLGPYGEPGGGAVSYAQGTPLST